MGFKRVFTSLTGPRAPRLATRDSNAPRIEAALLSVHTAEQMIILSIDLETVAVVRQFARCGKAVTLFNNSISVHLRPTHGSAPGLQLPVKDPKRGWIIPLSRPMRDSIETHLNATPGSVEITPNLAFIVESAAR